ncbi:uncharacterized protein LOC143913981 [Arctopsyche grandis]|uniref:uncharacterized protein LOC143913981 n=1 Tax=Arctopsyche grandis TaxID=121162 RepID=UPI00406D9ABA
MESLGYYSNPKSFATDGFTPAVAALLTAVDAENSVSIFIEHNIGIKDISELSEIDLIVMGVDSLKTREDILKAAKQLPLNTQYSDVSDPKYLTAENISDILTENEKHLHRICSSLSANIILLKRTTCEDEIICRPSTYATDAILKSIDTMETLCFDIGNELKTLKNKNSAKRRKTQKKSVLVAVGSIAAVVLSICFAMSLKHVHQ